MKQICTSFAALLRDERGVTVIEYALIAGLVSIGIVAAATAIGQDVSAKFTAVLAGFKG